MNRDDVIRMAQEAGIVVIGEPAFKLCQLVAQHEREACAKVVETLWDTPTNGMATEEQFYGNECAKVIRARKQA